MISDRQRTGLPVSSSPSQTGNWETPSLTWHKERWPLLWHANAALIEQCSKQSRTPHLDTHFYLPVLQSGRQSAPARRHRVLRGSEGLQRNSGESSGEPTSQLINRRICLSSKKEGMKDHSHVSAAFNDSWQQRPRLPGERRIRGAARHHRLGKKTSGGTTNRKKKITIKYLIK